MYNKVTVPNPKYTRLRLSTLLLFLLAAIFAVMLIFVCLTNNKNLNGQISETSGTVTFAGLNDDGQYIIELDNEYTYMANPVREYLADPYSLTGEMTLILPQTQLKSTYRWVLGIRQDGREIVDYRITIADMRKNNGILITIFASMTGAFLIASSAIYYWQKKTPAIMEKDLTDAYCEYTLERQPSCPQYRHSRILLPVYLIVLMCAAIACGLADGPNVSLAAKIAILVVSISLVAAMTAIYLYLFFVWLPRQERKFYAENYPFDFTDISHVTMRKKQKEQLQQDLKEERAAFPDRYGDGGNGFLCDFGENGIRLSLEESPAPSAEDVFGEGGLSDEYVCELTYEELNFEAVPYYRNRDRSLFVVIKSRLSPDGKLSENPDVCNDIHIILDSNLLATLHKYNVPIENLDYILENKAALIEENCHKSRKSK